MKTREVLINLIVYLLILIITAVPNTALSADEKLELIVPLVIGGGLGGTIPTLVRIIKAERKQENKPAQKEVL